MPVWRLQPSATDAIRGFTRDEQEALYTLRECYRQSRDLFSAHELARLRFIRWLYEEGELGPPRCAPRYARLYRP
jgi:hypothetical protein